VVLGALVEEVVLADVTSAPAVDEVIYVVDEGE